MFGKSKPPPKSALADRMRQVTTHRPPPGSDDWTLEAVRPPSHKLAARSERAPVYRQGTLVLEDGQRMMVVLKNLSETGARVEYFLKQDLPAIVQIMEPTKRLRRRARVVWQGDGVAGIEFLPE